VKLRVTSALLAALPLVAVSPMLSARTGVSPQTSPPASQPSADAKTLVFADFERVENGRPVTARGGLIQMFGYEESKVHKSTFKGQEGADPPAPEIVRVKKEDPNHAMKFDFALFAPNQWAGVTVEFHGLPDGADGKLTPDDVSGFKTLSLEVYATGIEILRLEAIANERGKDMAMAYPQTTFRVRSGLNTYKVPLKNFNQPAWAEVKVDSKDVLKRLTAINLTAFCDQCEANKQGMVIVDNLVFEK
jgi:hypothetical protein